MSEPTFSHIIVGGGSAGCVLANRLSAVPSNRVLLLEAGRDTPPDQVEPEILDSYPRIAYFNEKNLWADLRVHLTPLSHNQGNHPAPRRYEQARLMGGGSSLNDMQANRGTPDDYDEWHAMGARGWAWQDVLPYFRKLERDMDFDGPLHGKTGPIPIRRIQPGAWPKFSTAVAAALADHGFTDLGDQNAIFDDGYFPLAISNLYDRRVSSAIGYLDHGVRRRKNLTIRPHCRLAHLVFDGSRVIGVTFVHRDHRETLYARETILALGAIHSPAMLLRSGIGPEVELRKLGIAVIANRRGVGANLQEHPTISISAFLKPEARLGKTLRRHIHIGLRYSSKLAGCQPNDMYMVALSKSGWHPVGEQLGSLTTWVNKPFSTGRVSLKTAGEFDEPQVEFNLLRDARDLERLTGAMHLLAHFFDHPVLQEAVSNPFPSSYSERIRDLGKVSTKNWALTSVLATLLDGPPGLRRYLLENVVTEGATLAELLCDPSALEAFIREKVHGVWHASGSCRMGESDDPDAVTDNQGRLYGVDCLRVVDASLMPRIPRANTNIPTIMLAEKISDAITSGSRAAP